MSKKKHDRPAPETLGLPRLGIDTHAHLDAEEFAGESETLLARAASAGLAAIGNVFLSPEAYLSGRELFANHPEVFFLLGIHPHDAAKAAPDVLDRMAQALAGDARLRAVGEIGLDFFYDLSPREVQARIFREQLDLARSLDSPVVIHSRDAVPETLAILDDLGFPGRPLLWHCFGAGPDLAAELLRRGWTLSIPGPVTYPKSVDLRAAVADIPLERMVIETDCPYLAPVPYRGHRNEPSYLGFTAACVAEVKGLDVEEVWRTCAANAREFFSLEDMRPFAAR